MRSYLISFALGGLVSLGEVISRYRDRPVAALKTPGAFVYLALNGVAGVCALWMARTFNVTFGAQGASAETVQLLVASLGAIAFLRTSLFIVRVGDADVGIGPSSVLTTLLNAADRSVDRKRAASRSKEVVDLMKNVDFMAASIALPTLCLALLQNLDPDDQQALAEDINSLVQSPMSDRQKSLALGLKLMNLAGPEVLRSAVEALGDEIQRVQVARV
ncbi:hypothetical protein OHA72_38465 [Dactylosporangium sp. NBC_01737]|uniref:hypothetical protein n=1 Tax=Dactylosporangium sp. NBC_01737 TaxID=2975959 RepID=UPI002E128E6D|nr:hypothetical protein OHA72_38465 [Dactylosporangium sp. NBC_01737]